MATPVSQCTTYAVEGNWPSNWQMTSFINSDTTPIEFQQVHAKHPTHEWMHGAGSRITVLATSAEKGNTNLVIYIMGIPNALTSLNAGDNSGRTPFHASVENGHYETARALINLKADVNIAKKDWSTPLFTAAKKGDLLMIKLLLQNKAVIAIGMTAPALNAQEKQWIVKVQKEIQDQFIQTIDESIKPTQIPASVLMLISDYGTFETGIESQPNFIVTFFIRIAKMLRLA